MKFENLTEKEVAQSGDIKKNGVSIDTANLDFIVTILSTNLYSKPIESFIRETVSNAWDSHKEAGNDNPVVLKIGKDTEDNYYCSIQDFGVGLSPDRFDKIYRNIGSSTKRDSNQQIGGFGIGRFSALAYASVVHITSVYDGVKYNYMMYKDGNTVSIDLLHEKDTDEPNGVEVRVAVKDGDLYRFSNSIKKQLLYFENLYVIDESGHNLDKDFNEAYMKDYRNFKVSTLKQSNSSILLGKVSYPLRVDSLNKMYDSRARTFPIALKFDIGELEVTPNREEILYSDRSIEIIEKRLDDALDEVNELIVDASNKDYDNFLEYRQALTQRFSMYFINKNGKSVSISISKKDANITLNGERYNSVNFEGMYNYMLNSMPVINSSYLLRDGRVTYEKVSLSISKIRDNFDRVYFSDVSELKKMSKDYIRDTFESVSYFIKPIDPKELLRLVIRDLNPNKNIRNYNTRYRSYSYDPKVMRLLLKHFGKNFKRVKTFSDKDVPQSWINAVKEERRQRRLEKKKNGYDPKASVALYRVRRSNTGYDKLTSDSNSYLLKDLGTRFRGISIYAEKDHPAVPHLYKMLEGRTDCRIFEVAETRAKNLTEIPNFVYIDDFTMDTNYKQIRNLATVSYLEKKLPNFEDIRNINNLSEISPKLQDVVDKLNIFLNSWRPYNFTRMQTNSEVMELLEDIYSVAEENGYFNLEVKALIDENLSMLNSAAMLKHFTHCHSNSLNNKAINLAVDYILSRKLFRPSVKAVLKLKEETIFNIKKEENDEDN